MNVAVVENNPTFEDVVYTFTDFSKQEDRDTQLCQLSLICGLKETA